MIRGFDNTASEGTCDGRVVSLLIVVPAVYFSLVFPTLFALGAEPQTIYYRYAEYGLMPLVASYALNLFYIVALVYACIKFIPRKVALSITENPYICALFLAYVIFNNYGNFGLSRDEIKLGSDLFSALSYSAIYAYLSAVVLCTRNIHSFYISLTALLVLVALTFEREAIVYALLPLLLRFSAGKHGLRNLIILGVVGAFLFFSYKFLQKAVRQDELLSVAASRESDLWAELLITFLRDNIHKSSMDIAYFAGDAPNYYYMSYFSPVQITRLLQDGATTNGNLATLYYTNGQTGTSFSAILEAWLNFGPLAPIVLPVAILLGAMLCFRLKSAFLLMAYLTFLSKLQRSELWPTTIGHLLGPIVVLLGVYLLRAIYLKLSRMAAAPDVP